MEIYARIALIDGVLKSGGCLSPEQFTGLKDLLEDFQNEARAKINKAAGVTNIERAFKVVIKAAEKGYNLSLKGAFKRGDYTYASDGHRLIRTKRPVSLPEANGVAADEFWEKAEKEIARYEEVELPDLAQFTLDVKTMQKQAGRGYRVLYRFENGLVLDADYLLEAMKATKAEKLVRDEGMTKKPVFLYGDDVDVLLLPVYTSEHTKPGLFTTL
jgi:hypothetical protein